MPPLVAHDCGYPPSRYTCRATRVAAGFLDFIAFCKCSTGVALHPLKILVSHLPPPLCREGVAPKFWLSEKVVALHGGVAATVTGVALHCATKVPPYGACFSYATPPFSCTPFPCGCIRAGAFEAEFAFQAHLVGVIVIVDFGHLPLPYLTGDTSEL